MIQNLTKLYEGADLSGAAADVIYLPILFDCTLNSVDVLTDEATSGDVEFSVWLNNVEQLSAAVTVSSGEKIGSSSGLSIALEKGDEIVLRRESGSISSPVTLNLVVDDGVSGGGGSGSPDISPIVKPPTYSGGNWTDINKGTSVFADVRDTLQLSCAGNYANFRGIYQPVTPSANWTVTMAYYDSNYYDTSQIGFLVKQTSGIIYHHALGVYSGSLYIISQLISDVTNWSDSPAGYIAIPRPPTGIVWLKFNLDSANSRLNIYFSLDGFNWKFLNYAGGYGAGDKPGFGNHAAYASTTATLISWDIS